MFFCKFTSSLEFFFIISAYHLVFIISVCPLILSFPFIILFLTFRLSSSFYHFRLSSCFYHFRLFSSFIISVCLLVLSFPVSDSFFFCEPFKQSSPMSTTEHFVIRHHRPPQNISSFGTSRKITDFASHNDWSCG